MDGLVSKASMIRLSLHPLPASETSAFNKIRAFSTRRAGLFPFRINVSSRSRSSPLSLTTYFFTEISFAAMIASLASRWRRKRITKSFRIGGSGRLGFVKSLTRAQVDGAEDKVIAWTGGGNDRKMKGKDYLQQFALPNFFFFVTTAYNILRHRGVLLGKRDFLGPVNWL